MSAPAPSWEVTLLRRPPGSGRRRVMGRARFQAPDVTRAREKAKAALARRACGQPRWSLGLLRPLTPNAPGTRLYTVTFAIWEAREDRFVRRDVHKHEVWASDATSARRVACEQIQAMSSYRPAWRVTQVTSGKLPRPARPAALSSRSRGAQPSPSA